MSTESVNTTEGWSEAFADWPYEERWHSAFRRWKYENHGID